jgi:ribosomal protein S18 acetylase RimI-like enzyme
VIIRLHNLPTERLSGLVAESEETGYRFLRRLIDDWESGANRFRRPGEALFAALAGDRGDRIIGVCGLNIDPYLSEGRVGRVRHLYVAIDFRRRGIGRQLVAEVVEAARGKFDLLRLRTDDAAAALFYEKIGFQACSGVRDCTHILRING